MFQLFQFRRLWLGLALVVAGALSASAQEQTPPHSGPVPAVPPLGSPERPAPRLPVTTPVPPSPPVVKAPVAPTVKSLDNKKPDEKKSDLPK
jgi:hypothetical protein